MQNGAKQGRNTRISLIDRSQKYSRGWTKTEFHRWFSRVSTASRKLLRRAPVPPVSWETIQAHWRRETNPKGKIEGAAGVAGIVSLKSN